MIRIDLGKDELQKPGKRAKSVDLKRLKLGNFGDLRKLSTDLGTFIMIGAAVGAPFMGHLFFEQFKAYLVRQHETRMRTLLEKSDEVNQEITKLQPFQKELESYEQQKKLVKDRLDVVKDLLASRGTPVNVLDALGQSLPQRTWVTGVTMSLGAASDLKITGSSYSNEDISDFVDKLSESVHFSDVTLESVSDNKGDNQIEVRNFAVTAHPKVRFPVFAKKADPNAPPGAAPATPPGVQPPAVAGDPGAAQPATPPGVAPPPPPGQAPPPGAQPGRGTAGQ